ncbi:major facilitator superfamily domain-containing protein [Ephemerocybe angulata]|uniref:Major facilitator superfamily domain-containing protein n=1 Tax=Ephemerocybe angulata TaxID=980116 RepID=A0A8H6I3N0_9AGAR|nr:major facilitator superfamily domain-containing protein [Tulosesus angulatus]
MTLAPRVEVYTQLACYSLYTPQPSPPPINIPSSRDVVQWTPFSAISLFSSLDPRGPHLFPAPQIQRDRLPRDNATSSSPTTPILLSSPLDDEALAQQDPRNLPSHRCLTDPAVQASAARLQTLMTTTMGLLSALTTTFWAVFSQTHGRTKVLAISTFGLLFTDLIFILTSTPNLPWPLSIHPTGHATSTHLLLLGPIVEGALGGWTTLQSATSAYISDCTSVGSRAGVFSRFTGVFYAGFSVGPMIAGYIVRHPEIIVGVNTTKQRPVQSVTAVFWVAILCSFVNFLLVLFVFPESLDKEKQKAAAAALAAHADPKGKARATEEDEAALLSPGLQILQSPIHSSSTSSHPFAASEPTAPPQPTTLVSTLLRPLAIFRPVPIVLPTRNGLLLRTKYDWSLTLLALSLGGWMLSTGVYQIKYLYAEHVYGWGCGGAQRVYQLDGAVRAGVLLWGVPGLVGWLKGRAAEREREREANGRAAKPPLSRLTLGKSIQFDLRLARLSLFIDLLSNILITVTPSPSFHASSLRYYMDSRFGAGAGASAVTVVPGGGVTGPMSHGQSQAMFVAASSLSALGGGLVPAVHSLALCIVQVRALEPDVASSSGENGSAAQASPLVDSGSLFGAFAVLQALGQMILGPMLFGLVYSSTVAGYPKTVFVLSTALLFLSMLLLLCVRNPVGEVRLEKRDRKFRERIGSAPVGGVSLSYREERMRVTMSA